MVEAKLLRKKLKNGLIVDKWDLVTIIEKQQDEIDELKEKVKQNADLEEKADLCKEKLEPVAWMQVHYKDNKPTKFSTVQTWEDDVPLYTHPAEHDLGIAEAIGFDKGYKAAIAKTLTDEEIVDIIQRLIADWSDDFKNFKYASEEPEENRLRADVFVILRKAQEK